MNDISIESIRRDGNYNFKEIFDQSDDQSDNLQNSIYNTVNLHKCDYTDINDFCNMYGVNSNQFSLYSHNVRSLVNKFDDFKILIDTLNHNKFKFSVIAVTEIWSIPPNNNFNIPGYSPLQFKVRNKIGNKHNVGGGVGLWVDQKYSFENLDELSFGMSLVFSSIRGWFIKSNMYKFKNFFNYLVART